MTTAPIPESPQAPHRRNSSGGVLLRLLAGIGLSVACLAAYLELGAGAGGVPAMLVLATPAVAVAGELFLRWRSGRRHYVRSGVLLFGIALPFVLVSCKLSEWSGRTRFDSARWKAAAQTRSPERLRQVDHLIASRVLERRTRAEVLDLLGPDGGEGHFPDWECVYWLGPQRGFVAIDSEWLVIRFDEAGIVREYALVHD